jgi:ABC-type phosphate/phosphonate transport system permease subunit
MNIETILLLVILTFGFVFLLDQWSTRARRQRE